MSKSGKLVGSGLLLLFVSFFESSQFALKFGDTKKGVRRHSLFTSGLVDNENVASRANKSLSRDPFSSNSFNGVVGALSAYNWIIMELFHQILPCTIVGHLSVSLSAPAGQIPAVHIHVLTVQKTPRQSGLD